MGLGRYAVVSNVFILVFDFLTSDLSSALICAFKKIYPGISIMESLDILANLCFHFTEVMSTILANVFETRKFF